MKHKSPTEMIQLYEVLIPKGNDFCAFINNIMVEDYSLRYTMRQ